MPQTAVRLNKRIIENIEPGKTIWDAQVKGFGARALVSKVTYILKYRHRQRQRWYSIGTHGSPWTVDMARKEAQRLIGLVQSGIDIAAERAALREAPTVAELCQRYLEDHAAHHKRPSSIRMDEANIANHVLPLIGKMAVADVTRADIDKLKRSVRDGKTAPLKNRNRNARAGGGRIKGGAGAANRVLALLSKMFYLAEAWGFRPEHTNPVRLVAKYAEHKRQRFLSQEELHRLGRVLDEAEKSGEDVYVIAAIRLLLLTGARLGEILGLTWDEVDAERKLLLLKNSKTGPRPVFLNDTAVELLTSLPRKPNNPHVIAGRCDGRPLVNLQKPWGRIRHLADLDDVRLHDLRHSFASLAAANGASLPMIGALLGHTSPQTTQRYAHLAHDPVRELNDAIGRRLAATIRVTT